MTRRPPRAPGSRYHTSPGTPDMRGTPPPTAGACFDFSKTYSGAHAQEPRISSCLDRQTDPAPSAPAARVDCESLSLDVVQAIKAQSRRSSFRPDRRETARVL